MPILLFRVVDTFQIKDRGLVIATDTLIRTIPFVLRIGTLIEFRTPDGISLASSIKGLEFSQPFNPNTPFIFLIETPFVLPRGTEVWLAHHPQVSE